MNCTQCQNELEDFLYGELDEARAQTLRAHLRTCEACAAQQAALEREQEMFTQYYEQTALEPSDALWKAIQTRLHEAPRATVTEPEQSWWQRLFATPGWWQQTVFATALVLVSVAATTFYFKWQAQSNQGSDGKGNDGLVAAASPSPQVSPTDAPTPEPVSAPKANAPQEKRPALSPSPKPLKLSEEQTLQNQLARAEREYQQAIKLLDRVIARKRDQFEPAVWQQYQSSLALIDNSIAESRRALRGEMTDAANSQFLLAAYARKLDLMRDIAMQAGQ